MSIISYAQNGEDIVLSRALADVSKGFYIDVGAQDPTVDSVTRLFYEREWSGVNIEPVLHWHARLEEQRPRDVNLCVAAGDHPGEISLFEVIGTGLSTTVGDVADRHLAEGRKVVERSVTMTTLDDVCTAHGIEQVHFLKVDVEGAETSVLRGISLDRVRPWIILVEATQPNTQVPTHEAWESLLTARGYQFVYADGLNRFYLANEHQQLRPSFAVPPNCFDDFITYREHVGGEYANELESKLEILHAQATGLRDQLGDIQAQNERVQVALDRVVVERTDLIGQMEAVRVVAENRQRRIEQLVEVAENRQALIEQLSEVTESQRTQVEQVLEVAENRRLRMEQLGEVAQNRQMQVEQLLEVAENRQLRIEQLGEMVESRQLRIERLSEELDTSVTASARLSTDLQVLLTTAQNRQNRIVELQGQHAELESRLNMAAFEIAQRDSTLATILASHSWRLTRPLRVSRRMVSAVLRRGLRRPLRVLGRQMLKAKCIRRAARRMLASHPALHLRLSAFLFGSAPTVVAGNVALVDADAATVDTSLSARERVVLSIFEQTGRSKDSARETN